MSAGAKRLEIHQAPGPPRTTVVLVERERIAVLEVAPGRERGAVEHTDRHRWRMHRRPGSSEWWITDESDLPLGTVSRTNPLAERFTVELDGEEFDVVPLSWWWRRRWRVVDASGRQLVEVVQRPFARSVHDLTLRSGDVPLRLPLTVAWVLALVTNVREPVARRSRWTNA